MDTPTRSTNAPRRSGPVAPPEPAAVAAAVATFLDRHAAPVGPRVVWMDLLAALVQLTRCGGAAVWSPPDAEPLAAVRARQPDDTWDDNGLPRVSDPERRWFAAVAGPTLRGGPEALVAGGPPCDPERVGPGLRASNLLALPAELAGRRIGVVALAGVAVAPAEVWAERLRPMLFAAATLAAWGEARRTAPPGRHDSLARMAAGFAHDFNNILTSVRGYAELALESTSEAVTRDLIREVVQSAERAADFTRRVSSYAGTLAVPLRPLDPRPALLAALATAEARRPAGAELAADLADPLPQCAIDPMTVSLAVEHMLANAFESLHGRPGRVAVAARPEAALPAGAWHLAPPAEGPGVLVEVADTGEGIDPDHLPFVFDPYFSTRFSGRGLGLSAVWGTARSIAGGVRAAHRPSGGTIVQIYLPAAH